MSLSLCVTLDRRQFRKAEDATFNQPNGEFSTVADGVLFPGLARASCTDADIHMPSVKPLQTQVSQFCGIAFEAKFVFILSILQLQHGVNPHQQCRASRGCLSKTADATRGSVYGQRAGIIHNPWAAWRGTLNSHIRGQQLKVLNFRIVSGSLRSAGRLKNLRALVKGPKSDPASWKRRGLWIPLQGI